MHILIGLIISVCVFAGFHQVQPVPENEIQIDYAVQTGEADFVFWQVNSLKSIKSNNIITQNYDYSCGSAALATLLNFYLGENFTEYQVIQGLLEYGDKNKIAERRAFSLLDMKGFVNKLGYRGAGYKAELDDLLEMDKPLILPIEKSGFRHFVVFKGIYNGHIFLADPFEGNTSYTVEKFQEMWFNNIIFIVYPEGANELNTFQISADDLRYIDEDSVVDILSIYTPEAINWDGGEDFFTLPDKYQKYNPW